MMLDLYTAVLTPDGRTGIFVGGVYGPGGDTEEVLFEDGSLWKFPGGQLRRARIAIRYDMSRQTFRQGANPTWKKVLQRWFWCNRVTQAMHAIELDNERQSCQGGFVAPLDDYGIWNAIVWTWGRSGVFYETWAMRTAWLLLFHTGLPRDEELDAAVDAGEPDREFRVRRYHEEWDMRAGHTMQLKLFD